MMNNYQSGDIMNYVFDKDLNALRTTSTIGNGITIMGSSGTSGTSGKDGIVGSKGDSGSSGTSGKNGWDGWDGSSGTSGKDGIVGSKGDNGSSGTSGSSGKDGLYGSSGTSGSITLPEWLYVDDIQYDLRGIRNGDIYIVDLEPSYTYQLSAITCKSDIPCVIDIYDGNILTVKDISVTNIKQTTYNSNQIKNELKIIIKDTVGVDNNLIIKFKNRIIV